MKSDWYTMVKALAESLGDTRVPLANLQGPLNWCMDKTHRPPSRFYGEEEVDDLLNRIKPLVDPAPDPDGVGGELSWRHHGGDLAFSLQDAKKAAMKYAQGAMKYAQKTVAEVKGSVNNAAAKMNELVKKTERRVHRKEDMAQAEQHRTEGFTQAEKRLASLFQPPPGWPWG